MKFSAKNRQLRQAPNHYQQLKTELKKKQK